jgi:hypothetical protein
MVNAIAPLQQRFVGQGVETARSHILLDLAVPDAGIELGEPRAERCQVLGRQLTNRVFDLLNAAHHP